MEKAATSLELYRVDHRGERRQLKFAPHSGQIQALDSGRRFVAVLSGTQAGKTALGPFWLHREIYGWPGFSGQGGRGSGDYLAVTASYDLFKLKMLPAILDLFQRRTRLGRYWAGDRVMELRPHRGVPFTANQASDPMWGRIILRSAESPGGLESSTAKAAWLDEAGLPSFTGETWRAVLSRLSLNLGRSLITTTLYNFGWLKTEFYDRWQAGDSDYDVVHFDSTANPAFPTVEWDRARRSMPPWRFDLRYRGRYSRPAGLIYDCYRDEPFPGGEMVEPFDPPSPWPRHIGIDFGGVNTASVIVVEDPATGLLYAVGEYQEGDKTSAGHAESILLQATPGLIGQVVGGSPSEGQWRREFQAGGLDVQAPDVSEVDVGIDRVYGLFKSGRLKVARNLTGLRKELTSYSRKLGADGEPTDVIEDKSKYHKLDALRYIGSYLAGPGPSDRNMTVAANPLAGYRGRGVPGRSRGLGRG